MILKDQIQYKIRQLNVAEKIILINIICFVLPLLFRTLLFLFNIPSDHFLGLFELSSSFKDLIFKPWTVFTMVFYIQDFSSFLEYVFTLFFLKSVAESI